METFIASLTADCVRVALLQAHAHAADVRDPAWEIHDLKSAVAKFAQLAEQMAAVEARLAKLTGPRCTNHPDRPSRVNLDGEDLCQECANEWARAEGQSAAQADAEEVEDQRRDNPLEPNFRKLGQ